MWLTHQKLLATGLTAVSSGSVPLTWNRDEAPPLYRNSSLKSCEFCQLVAKVTSAGVIRLGVVAGVPGGQVLSFGVHLPGWLHSASALNTSSESTVR